MADQYTKTQLAMIAAPNFNDPSHYAGELQKAFLAINENFKKIASMPFVQGVQGDNYELDPRDIFDESSNALTNDGALLLNSIFQENLFSAGQVKSDCISTLEGNSKYYIISKTSDGEDKKVTPLECFRDGRAINKIYFYSVVNDEGVKTNSYLGQLYYFIDGRITEIGNVFGDNPTSLRGFTDYSGFYTYIPQNGNEAAHYEKTEILPTIYYDQERNDICWFLNGQQTGISAMGAKGEDGKDAAMTFVRVVPVPSTNLNENQTQGTVDALYNYGKYNETITNEWDTNPDDIKAIKDGIALICIPSITPTHKCRVCPECGEEYTDTINTGTRFAFGIVKSEGDTKVAYWNADTVLDDFLADEKITDYFNRIGYHSTASSATCFSIPAYPTKLIISGALIKHSMCCAWNGDENLPQDLLFMRIKGIGTPIKWKRDTSTTGGQNVRLDNYNLVVQRFDLTGDITSINPPSNLTRNYTKITNDSIIVSNGIEADNPNPSDELNTTYSQIKASGTSHIGGDLEVVGKATINGGATINQGLTINTGLTVNSGNAVVKNDLIVDKDIHVGGKIYGNIIFNNQDTSSNAVRKIEISKKSGTNRHLDLITDGVYIHEGSYGNGGANLYIDGSIQRCNNIELENSLSLKDHIVFNNSGSRYWHHINVIGEGNTAGENSSHLAIKSKIVEVFDKEGQSKKSNSRFQVYGDGNFFGLKGALYWRSLYGGESPSCDIINNVTTYNTSEGDSYVVRVWKLKDSEYTYQILGFNEESNDGHNAIAIPATYPKWTTVFVMFNDKNGQHFNFIKSKSSSGKIIRVNSNDMGTSNSGMYVVCLGGEEFDLSGYKCRSISNVYRIGSTIY